MRKAISYGGYTLAALAIVIILANATPAFQNMPGLIVEEVVADSPGAKAGLKVGDRLLSYDDKGLPSIAALQAAQQNIIAKKEVILLVRRGEKTLTVPVPVGRLGVVLRPELPQSALAFYTEGQAAAQAERDDEAISKWTGAAKAAIEAGDKGAAVWLYSLAGEIYEAQRKWKEAQDMYGAGWKLLESSSDAAARSRILLSLGQCSMGLNDFPSAQRWYEQAAKVDEAAGNPIWVAADFGTLGQIAHSRGDLQAAQNYCNRALTICERLAPNSPGVAHSLSCLGIITLSRGDLKAAQDYHSRALAIYERLDPDSLDVAGSLNRLGNVARSRSDLQAAQDYYSRALKIEERLDPDSLDVASSLNNLGNVALSRGDLQAAQDYYGRALKIKERLAPNSLDVAISLNNLGNVALDRGDIQTAQNYYSHALTIYERLAPDSLDFAGNLNNLGSVALDRGDLQAAQDYHSRALKIKERLAPDSLNFATSLQSLGNVAIFRGDIQAAQDYHSRALAIRERLAPGSLDVAGSLNNMGKVANSRGDLQSAQDFYYRALAIYERLAPNSLKAATSLNNIGDLALTRRDLQAAQDYHSRALAIRERLAPDSLDVAGSLTNMGNVALDRGDIQAAQDYHSRALKIKERLIPGSLEVAGSLNNLGNIVRSRGDLQAAQDYHSRALKIKERLASDSLNVAISLNNLGIVAISKYDLQAAQDYHSRALAIRERLAPDSLDVAGSLTNLGNVALDRGDIQAAQDYHSRALKIEERLAPNSLNAANSLGNLGNVARSRGNLQAAQDYYNRALKIEERVAPSSLDVATSLNNLGIVALKQLRFPDALQLFSRAIEIVENQRSRILSPEARALLLAQQTVPYTGLLRTHLALNDLPSAFATIERARARSMVEMLAERQLDLRADVPPELLKRQDDLTRNRSAAATAFTNAQTQLPKAEAELRKLDPNKDANRIAVLKNQINEFEQQIKNLPAALIQYSVEQRYLDEEIRRAPNVSRRFADLQYPQPLGLTGAQATLDPGTLVLAYYLDYDESYLFAITKTNIKLFRLPARKDIANSLKAFQSEFAIGRRGLNDPTTIKTINEQGKKLYDLLIGPVQGLVTQADRILICPDGPLHTLPFAALVSQITPTPRYFIDDKPLHTIVSMTVYAQSRKPFAQTLAQKKHVLAFGDAVYTDYHAQQIMKQDSVKNPKQIGEIKKTQTSSDDDSDTSRWKFDSRLPNTKQEVEAIRRYDKSADIRLDLDATESAFRLLSKDYTILHLAVHGWADKRVGLDSGIALSQPKLLGKNETKDDNGMLQAWEIIEQVRLNADLVVLSACETGLGTTELGREGLVGLTRAFQYAGAKSIVVSLWKVLDKSTSELMMAFYDELFKGTSKDVALQKAMAKVRSNPSYHHPYYWSSFILTGDWQ